MTYSLNAKIAAFMFASAIMGCGPAVAQGYSPATVASHAAPRSANVPLGDVTNPQDTLANARGRDQSGAAVGYVGGVILDGDGKPVELKVDVSDYLGMGNKYVAMRASDFTFDKDQKILVTTLTKNQIHVLAGE